MAIVQEANARHEADIDWAQVAEKMNYSLGSKSSLSTKRCRERYELISITFVCHLASCSYGLGGGH